MKASKKIQNAWAFYDWSNSTYNLVIGTAIFPLFYTAVTRKTDANGVNSDMVDVFGFQLVNTELLSYSLALGMTIVCFLSPALSGVADYMGRKMTFLKFFCYLGAAACASLYFFDINHLELSMLSVVLACIGFWCSYAFANSFLPEIAAPDEQDKLSAKGFSLGYTGSVILLVICLIMIQVLDISARWCFVAVGIWWAGFAQYTFYHLKERRNDNEFKSQVISHGFQELKKVWGEMKQTVRLKSYLFAFWVFSMGVQTIMQMASLFGMKEVWRYDEEGKFVQGLSDGELITAVLLVQLIAIPGAVLFSYCSRKFGNLNTLKVALFVWACVCIFAYAIVKTPFTFYIAAGLIGFVMGGTQALARSTYSKFIPETKDHASYFSFYDVTEKVGLIIGLIAFGYLEHMGSMRTSILALIIFFIVGLFLIYLVPKKEKTIEGKVFWTE
jgi:MFS transporter, UMF1 family